MVTNTEEYVNTVLLSQISFRTPPNYHSSLDQYNSHLRTIFGRNTINERCALKSNRYSVCGQRRWGRWQGNDNILQMDAVNIRIQIRYWSCEHSVFSIDRPTLVRIRIDEITIQIVSYIINYALYYHYYFVCLFDIL